MARCTALIALVHIAAVAAHTRPRPVPPMRAWTIAEYASRFRCPAGNYIGNRKDHTPKLQRHIRQALSRSLVPSALDAPVRGVQNASLFYTHESMAWPKPARCKARRATVCQGSPHACLLLPQGNAPRTSLVSERYGIEFRQVWKVASSSLASFFYCNMWGDLRADKLLPSQPLPTRTSSARKPRVVFPTREPISRFVASSFEVLERLINRNSPGGQRMPDDMYIEPSGPFSSAVLLRGTRWYAPLTRLLNGTAAERDGLLHALVNGFIEDIECGIFYSAADHLATQMSFLTSGYAERASLDFQIRLTNITSDLERLARRIAYAPREATRGLNSSVWKCPLGRENDASNKAKLALRKEDFTSVLARNPSFVQRLCTVYMQDYLCLGFPLPAECEGGRELAWAAATSSTADEPSSDARPAASEGSSVHEPRRRGGKGGGRHSATEA